MFFNKNNGSYYLQIYGSENNNYEIWMETNWIYYYYECNLISIYYKIEKSHIENEIFYYNFFILIQSDFIFYLHIYYI